MTKRKGESYLGGSTVITLPPRLVEQGLVEQAREVKQQQRNDQQSFDQLCERRRTAAAELAHKNRLDRVDENIGQYYRKQIHHIEMLLKGKPSYSLRLLHQQLDLLEKLLKATPAKSWRNVIRRMRDVENKINRFRVTP
jgi:hypothetical protein